MYDNLTKIVLKFINSQDIPLETREIIDHAKSRSKTTTRTKVLHRLNLLRGDGLIKGRFLSAGKGIWIWWKLNAFKGKKRGKNV